MNHVIIDTRVEISTSQLCMTYKNDSGQTVNYTHIKYIYNSKHRVNNT